MKVIVTIPAYNEEQTIGTVINDIQNSLNNQVFTYEIQVIDDGSIDQTANIARSLGARVYSHPANFGLAETFRDEIQIALENGADIIVHFDADGQYRSGEILNLVGPIQDGKADLVLGSRFLGEIEEMPLIKKIGNRAFSQVVSHISGIKIIDAQTGFRAFTKDVAAKVKVNSEFTYTQEQIIKTARKKFRIMEVPIFFAKRMSGNSRLMSNPLEYAIKGNVNLLRIYRDFAPLHFFGFIGFILIVLAVLIAIFSIFFLNRLFDVTVLLLSLSGLQIILFGFLAEMIRE
jgi:glycosyltransferase involved in cell wall biosynthesis